MNKTIKKEIILLKDLGIKFTSSTQKEKRRYGLYKCFCGNEFETQIRNIKCNRVKSCGCLGTNNKHNLTKHRLYKTWNAIMQRCYNKNTINYVNYGGRGIKVCNEWLDVQNFVNDMFPTFQEGLSIDRINPNGNYEKENCRWANKSTQQRNTRKLISTNKSGYRGVTLHKAKKKWNAQIKVNYKRIHLGSFLTALDGAKAYDKYVIDNNLEHTKNFNIKDIECKTK